MIIVLFRKQIIIASFRTENVLDSHFSFQKKRRVSFLSETALDSLSSFAL